MLGHKEVPYPGPRGFVGTGPGGSINHGPRAAAGPEPRRVANLGLQEVAFPEPQGVVNPAPWRVVNAGPQAPGSCGPQGVASPEPRIVIKLARPPSFAPLKPVNAEPAERRFEPHSSNFEETKIKSEDDVMVDTKVDTSEVPVLRSLFS